ncbi:PEP-CTERM sorting domain-containing protein [Nostoc sp. FACHB-152]|uniref:PEP-CTERM sorting domain-containing protein n=1 Tax=unclassified Nostoc TaxID=2593658 RepID=UPI0016878628|nr:MULTISPECIES: PEP-CTERM sorting domain-containing protein [unclassified Nostoc]MBD2447180.1 PEP-CTERM sorting domain-containing protein [Nostoc sp. FACHB-152]MBD2469142.1 PEP-CTERM sorting domain-containing protein [Nostoc sp. FACHB-145]
MNSLNFAKTLITQIILVSGTIALLATTGVSQTTSSPESNLEYRGGGGAIIDRSPLQHPTQINVLPQPQITNFTKISEPSSVLGLIALSTIGAATLNKKKRLSIKK